ncbi:MAG: SIMPL domain-containing protein [Patescibacteria group bacterium]
MKRASVLILAIAILTLGAVAIVALVNKDKTTEYFTVSAEETVYAPADIASLEVGVRSGIKSTPQEAANESNNKTNDIIEELANLGVEEKDIKTSNYRLSPEYNWTESRGQQLVGYEVTQSLTIKIRDLEKISSVISQTTEKGANQVGNISFTIDDDESLKSEARAAAITKAQNKAKEIAAQSGLKLGRLLNVEEGYSSQIITPSYNKMMDLAGGSESVSAPNIQTGENEVSVSVILTYKVK